jgi:CRP-like cAMP-binding protein
MLKKILSIKPHDFEIQREITELLLEIRPERPSTSYITPPREEQPSEALKESFLRSELLPEPFRKDKVITLLYKADIATFPSQHRIIKEGDTDRTVYIIVRGSVEVKTDIKDQEISLAILQEGDIFGEIAFVTLSPRTASVISLTDTSVLVLEQDILDKIIHQEPLILKYLYDLYKSRR